MVNGWYDNSNSAKMTKVQPKKKKKHLKFDAAFFCCSKKTIELNA
jgi:hypothetical protein